MDPVTLALAVAVGALAVYALARPTAPAAPPAAPPATASAGLPGAPQSVRAGAPVTGPVYPTAIPAYGAQAPTAPPAWLYGVQAGLAAGQALPGLVSGVRGIADALGTAAFGAAGDASPVPAWEESLL